ncbi:hypothetical protein GQ43DRAFT_66981 [Delitschia confertaspora ATCC 74209]|uniref:BHLH domain-containing protein n=1 Tax=Delitschia confertaspora ATCC 74209 TaxID=1513339 RepID=A0A9P4JYY4_9PLEO|nr:hypothetical protein GQ43DRAFT_66981 [Delitschia confertaspora ATCC 74209]
MDPLAVWTAEADYDEINVMAEPNFNLFDPDISNVDYNNFHFDFLNDTPERNTSEHHTESSNSQNLFPPLPDPSEAVPQQEEDAASQSWTSQPQHPFHPFHMSVLTQTANQQYSAAHEQFLGTRARVPPTPNSAEMHANNLPYPQKRDFQAAAMSQQFHYGNDDLVAFTPIGSPAVTPHDARFSFPNHTVTPGAYHTPLVSPAMRPQQPQYPASSVRPQNDGSGSSGTGSPYVMTMFDPAVLRSETGRRLSSTKRSTPHPSNRVKQSPIVKPTRRKETLQSELDQSQQPSMQSSPNIHPLPRSRKGSRTESISPRPLTQMEPPANPASTMQSPAMVANNHQSPSVLSRRRGVPAATPSSIRQHPTPRISMPEVAPPALPYASSTAEDFALPDSALDPTSPFTLGTSIIQENDEGDFAIPEPKRQRKSPTLGPLSTPTAGGPVQPTQSPMLSAGLSPISPAFPPAKPGTGKKAASKARSTKKRGSVHSTLASPAILPKISADVTPNIKPLLPNKQPISEQSHALILASKSNYEHMIQGTAPPGVTFSDELRKDITAKKTSHKLAEQGRRDRINRAVEQLDALISPIMPAQDAEMPDLTGPGPGGGAGAGGERGKEKQADCKASKIEKAVVCVTHLLKEKERSEREMESLRREVEALKAMTPEMRAKSAM